MAVTTMARQIPSLSEPRIPELTLQQRLTALDHANDIRRARKDLKADLKAGRVSIHDVLANPPAYALTAKVETVLLAVPKYGPVKIRKVLAQCQISPSKTIGGLTERQRNTLLMLLRR